MDDAELLRRLNSFEVGFYAVALAFKAGRIDRATISDYLRRDAPKVVPQSRDARMQLAKDIDRDIRSAERAKLTEPAQEPGKVE